MERAMGIDQIRMNQTKALPPLLTSIGVKWSQIYFSGKSGGLNGSTQHSSRTRLALKTKAKSLARVRSAGTLPWLGFDRGQPNRSLLPGKYCRINALDGVASAR